MMMGDYPKGHVGLQEEPKDYMLRLSTAGEEGGALLERRGARQP